MSLFLRVDHENDPFEIIQLRGLEASLYLNDFGHITTVAGDKPIANFYAVANSYFITVADDNFSVNGSKCIGPWELSNLDQVRIGNHETTVLISSNEAESLAQQNIELGAKMPKNFAEINVKIANLAKNYCLMPKVTYSIGGAQSDDIFIDFFNLPASALNITYDSKKIIVEPVNSEIRVKGKKVNGVKNIVKTTKIEILPSGIQLDLINPASFIYDKK